MLGAQGISPAQHSLPPDARELGKAAHRNRVAALARELGLRLRCDGLVLHHLEVMARTHSCGLRPGSFRCSQQLLLDLIAPEPQGESQRPEERPKPDRVSPLDHELHARKANSHRFAGPLRDSEERLVEQVVQLACMVDSRLEFQPYESLSGGQLLREVYGLAAEGAVVPQAADALASLMTLRLEYFREAASNLPVFPAVALQLIELLADGDAPMAEFERLICSDQVLAGELIRYANSAYCGGRGEISTIPGALLHIGLDAARQVSTAAVFRPMFSRPGAHHLWLHSVEVAEMCERLASEAPDLNPAEAFLSGLVHDVGRLAIDTAPETLTAAYQRMLARGCEQSFADFLLMGCDHGAAGAEILRAWMFPPHLVDAVACHHRPECASSPYARIIYLAEFWSDSEEDFSSLARVEACMRAFGLTPPQLDFYARKKGMLSQIFGRA